MASQTIILLDIGSSRVTAAAAIFEDDGTIDIKSVVSLPHRDNVRYGHVVNVEETRRICWQVLQSLAKHLKGQRQRICALYLTVGGRGVSSLVIDTEHLFDTETLITTDILRVLEQQGREKFFGDTHLLGLYPRCYEVNSRQVPKASGMYGNSVGAKFNAVVCPAKLHRSLTRVFDNFDEVSPLEPMVARPVAQAQALLTDDERRLGVMLVDMGAETTTVSIYRDSILQYLVTLPLGGRNITRDLTTLGMTEDEAERFKCSRGHCMYQATTGGASLPDDEKQRYITARANEITANIANQLALSTLRANQLACGVVLTGGASRLRGVQQMLEDKTGLKVRTPSLPDGVLVSDATAHPQPLLDMACAFINLGTIQRRQACTRPLPQPVEKPHQASQSDFVIDQPATGSQHGSFTPEELLRQDANTPDDDTPQDSTKSGNRNREENREPRKTEGRTTRKIGVWFKNVFGNPPENNE